jgi:hypothetical protein
LTDLKSFLDSSDADTLNEIIGSDAVKKLRKADIAKLTGKRPEKPTRTKKPVKGQVKRGEKKVMGTDEWQDYLDSL